MTANEGIAGARVGFIGLGLMGRPMARNLHRAGADLVIHNRSRGVVDELAGEGMAAATSPKAVAEEVGAGVIIMMLTDTPAAEAVLFGDHGLADGLKPGALVIDMGTTAVSRTRRFAERIVELDAGYVDAPVSGGEIGAREGNLTIMAGGSDGDFARALPYFQVLGGKITHIGDVGAGQIAKMANQVIVALTIDAVAEALALAKAAGVEPGRVRDALVGGFAQSRILELHGKRMVDGAFTPGGRAVVQRKDVMQACELAAESGIDLPALQLNLTLWDRLIAEGDGDLDHSGLYRIYDRQLTGRAPSRSLQES